MLTIIIIGAHDDKNTQMDVINGGARSQVAELFEFAAELEDQVNHMMISLEQVQDTLSQLTALYPESLSYAGLDDAAVD